MKLHLRTLAACAGIVGALTFTGCEDSGGGHDDIGDNNPNLVLCVGDSITEGYRCDGAPYPAQLAPMIGKTVVNLGVGGADAGDGANWIMTQLKRKPGYVCILYGANDAIPGHSPIEAKENLRKIVTACKNAKSIPIIATTPPMIYGHSIFNGKAIHINEMIRALAKEEGIKCIDLYKAFGDGEGYFVRDGLHPNAAGAELIAKRFAGAL